MAFVLELQTTSSQKYLQNLVVNILRKNYINAKVTQDENNLYFICDQTDFLEKALEEVNTTLPASLFLKATNISQKEQEVNALAPLTLEYPLALGLCPSCQKEIFDVSSSRYYYPFTSCNSCGGNYSFVQSYPYERKNTSFKFLVPCSSCQEEQKNYGKHEQHVINSCHSCGVPVRLVGKTSERYANDAGSFRTMFEVAAKALQDNKKLLVKTTFGYRIFYKAQNFNKDSKLMMLNASKITDNLSLITEEFHALLSIERPVMHVTIKDEKLKDYVGANTTFVKYPDEGFSLLLGAELVKLGFEYIAYEDATSQTQADFVMEYDLEINPQKELHFFLNKDTSFIASGERVSFPSKMPQLKKELCVTNHLVGVPQDGEVFFDVMDHFESVVASGANILEGVEGQYHSAQKTITYEESAFVSVLAEHNKLNIKAVGAYFDDIPSFIYYDGKNPIRIVPPKEFITTTILEDIAQLREGSKRLVENLEKTLPEVYKKLQKLQTKENVKLFEAVAIILGLEDETYRGVSVEAMKFVGKGGIQIDTHVQDNRFNYTAFLASIISYQLAGVSSVILAYSIFESFGDYFSEIIGELQSKTKALEVVLCGGGFANQSLFSRVQRNFKINPPMMNKNYPISSESCVVGGVYM